MKLNQLTILGCVSTMLLSIASCTNDNILSEPNQPLEYDQSFYLPIAVSGFGDNGTRAEYDPTTDPSFDSGTATENDVQSIYLVFYDADGNRIASTPALKNLESTTTGLPEHQNALYTGVVQIDLLEGQTTPSYVLAFINPVNYSDIGGTSAAEDLSTLTNVEKATRASLIAEGGTDGLFAMSNSVYYDTDGNKVMATPIVEGQIFSTKEEAEDAIKQDPSAAFVDIYVERYAAKVNFSVAPDNIQEITMSNITGDSYKIKFVPEVWAVNANEEESFVTKNFFAQLGDNNEFDFTKPATYQQMNDILKPWFWNSPEKNRSYWGQSPNYYLASYPRVSDDISDKEGWVPGNKGDYKLKYYSYEEMKTNAGDGLSKLARNIDAATGKSAALYARENTVSGSSLHAAHADPFASPKAAIASIVMVGSYQVSVNDGDYANYNGNFYVTGNEENYMFFTEDQMKKYFINNFLKMAKDEDGTPFFSYKDLTSVADADFIDPDYKEYFTITHPSKEVRNGIVLDSRYVSLQFKPEAIGKVYIKKGDNYEALTAENINENNYQLLTMAGTAFGFNGGKAYYNIPIQHLGYYRSDNANQNVSGGANNADEFDWTKTKSGDFGLVRNHFYTIEATKISGLGNAIPNPEEPIVPPVDPEQYWIGARIVVLNWAVVPTQSVEL